MTNEYPDDCLSINGNDDMFKEKTRIAEVAAVTLCRLNGIMKQMKDWRDDRVKLRSNIWRLKLALRVAGKETNDTLDADPLVEHQRSEIKRLETDNQALKKEIADIKAAIVDADITNEAIYKSDEKLVEVKQEYLVEREYLNNEILYLQSRLNEVKEGHEHNSEAEHLKCKLKHFMMVDHTMEIIFTDIVNKVAETIANLSEELVNMNEHLHRSKLKNDHLYIKVDKLKAILRSKSGNIVDYQKRSVELDNLTKCLKTELEKFKSTLEDNTWIMDSTRQSNLNNVERLTNDLRNRLRNDYEAVLGAGDPDCLKYIQKIVELRVNLKQLHITLTKSNADLCPPHENLDDCSKYLKQLFNIESTLEEIDIEIDKLKDQHVRKNCRIGGTEGVKYLKKIEELRSIVEKIRIIISELNRRTGEDSNGGKKIAKLDNFVGRVCQEIKQLEVIVISDDRSALLKRIEHLEELMVRLKVESNEKNELVSTLTKKLLNAESLLEERTKEATNAGGQVDVLTEENKALQMRTKETEGKVLELQNEREATRKELEQLQRTKQDINIARKKLQNLRSEKEKLSKETEELRDTLEKRNEHVNIIVAEKLSVEKAFEAKITDLTSKLQVASEDNESLQNKVNEFEQLKSKLHNSAYVDKAVGNTKCLQETSENIDTELQELRSSLQTSKQALDITGREINDLKTRLKHLSTEKAKLESNNCRLESKKEILVYELGVEKAIAEERLVELTNLKSDYNRLDIERINTKNEKERLNTELTNVRAKKEQLEKSLENVEAKCLKLEDEINKYRSECSTVQEEARNFRTSKENLATKLEKTEAELNEATHKIRRLEFENSKLQDDLNDLSLKNITLEDRVQVLLTEKNDLVTRINELDEKNVALKDHLNKVKTENECSSVELNELRMECDKVKLENMSLQNMLDETNRRNEVLKKSGEELKLKLNEVYSEWRILKNQVRMLEMGSAALKKQKEALQHEYLNSLQSKISQFQNKNSKAVGNKIFKEHNEQNVEGVVKKVENGTKKTNKKSDKRANDNTKPKEQLKQLSVENEALKFEVLNLKDQNFNIKMEMSRLKDELQSQKARNNRSETEISNKLEIVNLYYKEINSYSSQHFDSMNTLACIDQSNVCPFVELQDDNEVDGLVEVINKLKIENVALKMEVNTLRWNENRRNENRRYELRNTQEEFQALKIELTTLRDEKETLQNRLDTVRTKLDELESEKVALKNELYTTRKMNSDVTPRANELQCDYQEMKESDEGFDSCIIEAIEKIKKYTTSPENLEEMDDELKVFLETYISNEKFLHPLTDRRINLEDT